MAGLEGSSQAGSALWLVGLLAALEEPRQAHGIQPFCPGAAPCPFYLVFLHPCQCLVCLTPSKDKMKAIAYTYLHVPR